MPFQGMTPESPGWAWGWGRGGTRDSRGRADTHMEHNSGLHTSSHTMSGQVEMFWINASSILVNGKCHASRSTKRTVAPIAIVLADSQSELFPIFPQPPMHHRLQLVNTVTWCEHLFTSLARKTVLRNVQGAYIYTQNDSQNHQWWKLSIHIHVFRMWYCYTPAATFKCCIVFKSNKQYT